MFVILTLNKNIGAQFKNVFDNFIKDFMHITPVAKVVVTFKLNLIRFTSNSIFFFT